LIALIINPHRTRRAWLPGSKPAQSGTDRKTSLRDRSDGWRSGTADIHAHPPTSCLM